MDFFLRDVPAQWRIQRLPDAGIPVLVPKELKTLCMPVSATLVCLKVSFV